jgi:heme/copper-type cytochrome/quinol oxidase subunit 2
MLHYLGLPMPASTHAGEIDHMLVLVHWLMLILFVGWGGFFVFVLFRFRKGANPKASYAGAKGKIAKSTEVAVAIV